MTSHFALLKPPSFNGKQGASYAIWDMKFRAYAQEKNFAEALLATHLTAMPASESDILDPTVSSDKVKIKAKEKNAKAMQALISAMTETKDMNKIMTEQRRDPYHPTGMACMVWAALKKEYMPCDSTAEADMERALLKIKLNKKTNPMRLLDEIAAIECRYNLSISAGRRRAIVLTAAGKDYSLVLSSTDLLYRTTAKREATAEELCEEMKSAWRISGGSDDGSGKESDDGIETALTTTGFKGKCRKCGKKGHKASQCPGKKDKSEETAGAASNGEKCKHCKKLGHSEDLCWKKYPEKVPEWAKAMRTKGASASEAAGATEVLVCSVAFEDELDECEEMDACLSLDIDISHDEEELADELEMEIENETTETKNAAKRRPEEENGNGGTTAVAVRETANQQESEPTMFEAGAGEENYEETGEENGANISGTPEDDPAEYGLVDNGQISIPNDIEILRSPNIWIGDTGASGHCTAHSHGGINKRPGVTTTTGVTGGTIKASMEMDIPTKHCDKFGKGEKRIVFKNVSYLENGNYNLCSLSRMMQEGWSMYGGDNGIEMTKENEIIRFDIIVKMAKGALYCGYFAREDGELAAVETGETPRVSMNVKRAHMLLGHCNEEATRKIAAHLGWEITRGTLRPCKDCAMAKARQAPVPKETAGDKAKEANERWYHDQSQIKPPEGYAGNKTTWHIMADEYTNLKVSGFYPTKNKFIEPFCKRMQQQAARGKPVKAVRMDNAGENKALHDRMTSAEWKLTVQIEYTARDTPQQNSLAVPNNCSKGACIKCGKCAAEVEMGPLP